MPTPINVPNLLTLARVILTPLAARAILARDYQQALAIFAIAGLTDGLDGLLARRFGAITRFGAYLDPIADKALLVTVYVVLGLTALVPWWLVALIFARDLFILAAVGAALLLTSERQFPPSVWGKASTFAQIVTAVVVIVNAEFGGSALNAISGALLLAVAALTAWSGLVYAHRAVRILCRERAATHAR